MSTEDIELIVPFLIKINLGYFSLLRLCRKAAIALGR
jgi:hypothetical protein